MSDKIEQLIDVEDWVNARKLITQNLEADPQSHWLWTRLGLTHYEQYDYEASLACSIKALEIQPECPLARWDHAGSLEMLGRYDEAITIFESLKATPIAKLAYDQCGEGVEWAEGLQADCIYRLGTCYRRKGIDVIAAGYFKEYIKKYANSAQSIYSVDEAKEQLRKMA